MNLYEFIFANAYKVELENHPDAVNVVFFCVQARSGVNAQQLADLVRQHQGVHCNVDLFDGNEHSYIEIGAFIGSQEAALMLIGLGAQLELWKLLSPKTMLGDDLPDGIERMMAGQGYISMQAIKSAIAV